MLLTPGQALAPELPQQQQAQIQESPKPAVVAHIETTIRNLSRGEPAVKIERRVMKLSAYTAGKESTGKTPSDPTYGQTAISTPEHPVYAREWYTIAAPPEISVGTQIYIPYFSDMPNQGLFIVEDRGGAIKGNCLDIYFGDPEKNKTALKRALEFGVRDLEVFIKK